jgi:hypothetical protein
VPPTQSPFRFDAAILSRIRSEVTSRSNWAKDKRTLSVTEDPKFLAQLESMGVTRARLMMNTNGFPIGAAPGSLSSGDRIKP